jgi:hypothetical protein
VSERFDPQARDRLLGRTRLAGWIVGATAAGATAMLSVVAAHAFRGHGGTPAHATATATASPVRVPPPQDVPAIDGAPPPPLQPPPSPPEAAPPQPAPVTSGGS